MTRRFLTPSPQQPAGLPPTRRHGGARKETSDRVRFISDGREIEGWALNKSRGGIRAVIDEPIELGKEVEVYVADAPARASRIVWIQEEPDGAIVGVEFLDMEGRGSVPPADAPSDDGNVVPGSDGKPDDER